MALGGAPMRRDTLFRIASITKPMTAATVLSFADHGLLDLEEPAQRLLPELAERKVLRRVITFVRPYRKLRSRCGSC